MSMTLETIRAAHARIAPYIVQTPLLRLPALDDALGCEVYVKAECMQRTGAFKLRGAMNKILAMTDAERARGFVAASSANHGRAVAYAAQHFGTHACIVMPRTAPAVKQPALRALGAQPVLCQKKGRKHPRRAKAAHDRTVLRLPFRRSKRKACRLYHTDARLVRIRRYLITAVRQCDVHTVDKVYVVLFARVDRLFRDCERRNPPRRHMQRLCCGSAQIFCCIFLQPSPDSAYPQHNMPPSPYFPDYDSACAAAKPQRAAVCVRRRFAERLPRLLYAVYAFRHAGQQDVNRPIF